MWPLNNCIELCPVVSWYESKLLDQQISQENMCYIPPLIKRVGPLTHFDLPPFPFLVGGTTGAFAVFLPATFAHFTAFLTTVAGSLLVL